MRSVLISGAIIAVSIVGCFFTYAYALVSALWVGIIIAFVFAALGIAHSRREREWLLIVVVLAISLRIPSFFQTEPWGFAYPMVDSAFDLTLSDLIRETGKWNPGMDFEVIKGYSYYPILHVLTAITSDVTGMDTTFFARVFPFLVAPLVTIFFYLLLKRMLSKEVAIWGSLMYNLNGNWLFWEYFIREFIALVFFSMCLYTIFHMYKIREGRRRFFMVGTLAAFATTLSHHWTSYNLLLTLSVLTVFPSVYTRVHAWLRRLRLRHKEQAPIDHQVLIPRLFLLTTFSMTFLWVSFISYRLFVIHTEEFLSFLTNVITPSPSFVLHSLEHFTFTMQFLLFFGYLLLGLLGIVGLFRHFFKRPKTYSDSIFDSWFVFSGVYILAATFLLPSGWSNISLRSWEFAFFGLVPLGAKTITEIQHWKRKSKSTSNLKQSSSLKTLAPLILIFPLISAVLMAPAEIRNPEYPHAGDSFHSTALWVRYYLPNETIALDPWARSVIIPYGRASTFPNLRWPGGTSGFLNAVYQSGDSIDLLSSSWEVIVFNRRISEWLTNASTDSSRLDQNYDRAYDSGSLVVYILINGAKE